MAVTTAKLGVLDIVILVAYFIVVIGIGFFAMYRSKRGTVSGYFLAGRFMTWLPVGASLFASNIGTEHFVGLTGSGAAGGLGVGVFEISSIVTIQALAWIFLPVYIASGCNTLPEYLSKRFGGQRIQMYLAILSLIMYIFTKLSVDLFSSALFIKTFFGWDLYSGVFLVLGMTAICTVTGGLAAVMYTETLQCVLMIVGGLFISIYSFVHIGGYEGLMTKYWIAVANDTAILNNSCGIPSANAFTMLRGVDDNSIPWLGFIFGQMIVSIWYWATDQLIVQRALAAKNISHAQGGTILTGYFKILPIFLMVFPGMISRVLFPNEVACVSNCEEICGSKSCSNIAFPKLVLDLMPVGFRGLIFAVFIAALMGNISALFNSSSTLFTMDVYSKIRRKASIRELMIVGRVYIVVLIVLSILWMPIIDRYQNGQIFLYMQNMFSYCAPPISISFLMAILWPRANEQGVFWALMVGLVMGAIRMILDLCYPAPPCGKPDDRPFIIGKLHFMYFAMILAITTALLIIIISLLTQAPDRKHLIRTTYWTRMDKSERDDDNAIEMSAKPASVQEGWTENAPNGVALTKSGRAKMMAIKGIKWFCGFDQAPQGAQEANAEQHLRNIRNLEQKPWQMVVLLANTILLLIVAIGLITFFSVWSPQIASRYKPNYNLTSMILGWQGR